MFLLFLVWFESKTYQNMSKFIKWNCTRRKSYKLYLPVLIMLFDLLNKIISLSELSIQFTPSFFTKHCVVTDFFPQIFSRFSNKLSILDQCVLGRAPVLWNLARTHLKPVPSSLLLKLAALACLAPLDCTVQPALHCMAWEQFLSLSGF